MTPPLLPLLAEAAPAAGGGGTTSTGAPSEAPAPGGESKGLFDVGILLPIGLMFAVMYFLMIRPQQRKEKELRALVDRMKKNDKVWLQGGIFGVVAQVREKDVIVKIDENKDVKIRVLKSAVLGIEGKAGEAPEAPAAETEAEKSAKEEAGK